MKRFVLFLLLFGCAACEEDLSPPEIWIDISPVYVGIHEINPESEPYHFDLRFTNRGEEALEIESARIRGDQYCAFEFQGPDILELGEDESAFMRGWYNPAVAADDQIALELYSNAVNYPMLVVPVCGRGVLPGTQDAGPAPSCNVPPTSQPDCPEP
jgi:hypothetical protein